MGSDLTAATALLRCRQARRGRLLRKKQLPPAHTRATPLLRSHLCTQVSTAVLVRVSEIVRRV